VGIVKEVPRAVVHLAEGRVVAAAQAAKVVAHCKAVIHRRNVLRRIKADQALR
jgi:ABC-type antimicrobial peptide transport system ATPase subunit